MESGLERVNVGSPFSDDTIEFMREALASNFALSKVIWKARELIEADGRNFNEEFRKWQESRTKSALKGAS